MFGRRAHQPQAELLRLGLKHFQVVRRAAHRVVLELVLDRLDFMDHEAADGVAQLLQFFGKLPRA